MKEIKFRAWDRHNKKMIEGIGTTPTSDLDVAYMIDECGEPNYGINASQIMQYTGIKDKNGVEIYEGDIIKGPFDFGPFGVKERVAEVYFNPHSGYQWHYWMDLSENEVIGNIYENPELIENEDETE